MRISDWSSDVCSSDLFAAALLLTCLGGCSTLKGAPDALINLAGQSTQSGFQGKYLEQEEVRSYFRLDPQHNHNLRLSYDGRSLPANEIRQQNVVLIPALQNYLQGIVERLAKGWPGEQPQLRVTVTDSYSFGPSRSEEHTSELQSLMRISYAVF